MGFYCFLDVPEILQLELLAIFNGLSLAWDNGYRIVECFLDSHDALSLVSSGLLTGRVLHAHMRYQGLIGASVDGGS